MRALLALLVFAIPSVAQSSINPDDFLDKKILRNADVNQLWRTLGVSEKIHETTESASKDTNQIFDCGTRDDDYREAQYFNLGWPLLEGGGEDGAVRLSHGYEWSRFLVFHRQDAAWRLVDYLDSTDSHYSPANTSVVYSGGKSWLVVTSAPRCGTGCSLEPANWFDLKNGEFRRVLTVPVSGQQGNENPARQFETRFVRASRSGARETLEFVYHVGFSAGLVRRLRPICGTTKKSFDFPGLLVKVNSSLTPITQRHGKLSSPTFLVQRKSNSHSSLV